MISNMLQWDRVNPVFFAVVPDSFMAREGDGSPVTPLSGVDDDDVFAIERPIVGQADRWSF
jgi:hypothetical protein